MREEAEETSDEETPRRKPRRDAVLLSGKADEAKVLVDGHQLKFTHVNKVLFPSDGYTKRDLLNYYDGVSDLLLPHMKDRPLSLKRYPNGIQEEFFFQKNTPAAIRIGCVLNISTAGTAIRRKRRGRFAMCWRKIARRCCI